MDISDFEVREKDGTIRPATVKDLLEAIETQFSPEVGKSALYMAPWGKDGRGLFRKGNAKDWVKNDAIVRHMISHF